MSYLLLVAGLALIVFEFFAASVGFAAGVGALALLGAGYGCSHLPVHWWAAVLVAAGIVAYAVDVQAGGVGVWTGIGRAIAGSEVEMTVPSMFSMNRAVAMMKAVRMAERIGGFQVEALWRRGRAAARRRPDTAVTMG